MTEYLKIFLIIFGIILIGGGGSIALVAVVQLVYTLVPYYLFGIFLAILGIFAVSIGTFCFDDLDK